MPVVEGMDIKVDYASIMANWKNKQLSEMTLPSTIPAILSCYVLTSLFSAAHD